MVELDIESPGQTTGQDCPNLAQVVEGPESSLNGLCLTQPELMKVLLRLLTCSKEIAAAMLRETMSGFDEYEDDTVEKRYICRIYGNTSLAIKRMSRVKTENGPLAQKERGHYLSTCLANLYAALADIGGLLDRKTIENEIDLMYWHAGQVLALTVCVVDIIQAHAFNSDSTRNQDSCRRPSALTVKTTQIIEIITRSVNRLRPKNVVSIAVLFRTAAELHILNRLVINTEHFKLQQSEISILQGLLSRRLLVLRHQISLVAAASYSDMENRLLCQIADSTLLYYEGAVCKALGICDPLKLRSIDSSLAFCLIRDLSLALETRILLADIKNTASREDIAINQGVFGKASDLRNYIYTAITSYHRQLLLQNTNSLTAGRADYNTCLNCIESAQQKAENIRSEDPSYGNVVDKHLEMLAESLTASGKLCALALRDATKHSADSYPSSKLDADLSVLNCFCSSNEAALWNSIDEEMWLQGRGGGW